MLSVIALAGLCACTNFHVVEEGRFYRSGQMSAKQFQQTIDRYGIRTVVRLRGRGSTFRETYKPVVESGLDFVLLRLSARRFPTRAELLGLWDIFATVEYPILVHCAAGADRTGMASTIYVLQRTGDFDQAMGQLAFLPYWHLGWFSVDCIDEVFAMYEPFHGKMSFPDWVREEYRYPGMTDREGPYPLPDR